MADNMIREKAAALLAGADEEAHLEGLRILAMQDGAGALDLLFQAFGAASWRVRKEATELFLRLPASRGQIGAVIELLYAEDNAGLRNTAVDILIRMGEVAVPLLLAEMSSSDPGVRKFVIDILGEIAAPAAVPKLLVALDDTDRNVRAAAAENLGKLRASAALPALLKAVTDPDVLLQFTILEALGKIGVPVPFSFLAPLRGEKLLRKALIECLGKSGDADSAGELLACMADPMRNVREAALLGLVALADRYPEEVRQLLASQDLSAMIDTLLVYLGPEQDSASRRAAVRVLGWMGASRAVRSLLAYLDDETLQQDILFALVNIGTRHPQSLLEVWPHASSLERAYLAWVFGESGCSASLPLLRQALADTDERLSQMAAHALGRLGGHAELPLLVTCLQHASADVRAAAAQSLGTLGQGSPGELLAALEPLLAADEPLQRSAAVSVLGRLAGQHLVAKRLAMALKDPAVEVRRAAMRALSREVVADQLSAILLALTDEDADVRRIAAEVLGNCSAAEALAGLRLALCDEDLWVRSTAVRSLGRLGGAGESAAIAALLADPVGLVCIAALETLAELLGEGVCAYLLPALDHPDLEVVGVALALLTRHAGATWLAANAELLLSHHSAQVREQCIRLIAAGGGACARQILERQLAAEEVESLRHLLRETLAELPQR